MIQGKAVEWYNEVDGQDDNSLMDTNQSEDVYLKDSVDSERLEE